MKNINEISTSTLDNIQPSQKEIVDLPLQEIHSHTSNISSILELAKTFTKDGLKKSLSLTEQELVYIRQLAQNHIQQKAFHEAMRLCSFLILCDPSNIDNQVLTASCALELNDNDLALKSACIVTGLAPKDARGYFLSGRACFAMGAFMEAEEDLKESLVLAKASGHNAIAEASQKILNTLKLLDSQSNSLQ